MLPKNDCLNNWLGNAYLPQQFLAAQVCLCSHSHPCHTLWMSTSACVPVFLVKQDSRQPHTPENQWCYPEETEEDPNDTTVYSWQKSVNKTWIRNCQETLLGTVISVPFRRAAQQRAEPCFSAPRHPQAWQWRAKQLSCSATLGGTCQDSREEFKLKHPETTDNTDHTEDGEAEEDWCWRHWQVKTRMSELVNIPLLLSI